MPLLRKYSTSAVASIRTNVSNSAVVSLDVMETRAFGRGLMLSRIPERGEDLEVSEP